MADCTIRRRDESWIEVILPTPSYSGELGKAHQIMLGQLDLDPGIVKDDAYQVIVGDDEIILRAKAPSTTIKVRWHEDAIRSALARLIEFRDGESVIDPIEQAVMVAIDCLRAAGGRSNRD